MGTFSISIEMGDLQGTYFKRVDVLMDTDKFNLIMPSSSLHKIGIEPERMNSFQLPDGSMREFAVTDVRIRYEDSTAVSPVVFGDEDAVPTLGRYALAGLLLDVDPEQECLVPVVPRLCNHPYPVHPVHQC